MTASRRLAIAVASAVAGLASGGAGARAQQCPGVEYRITQSTSELGTEVSAHMAAGTASLIEQHDLKVEALLSAMRVAVAQSSTSASQVNAAILKSSEAAASAYVAGRLRSLTVEAADEFGSVGYAACHVGDQMTAYAEARRLAGLSLAALPTGPAAAPGLIGDPRGWYQEMAQGGSYSAGSLFDGDTAAASRYIDGVMGPPDQWRRQDSAEAEAGVYFAGKLVRDARKGVAQQVLRTVAAGNAAAGPRRALQAVVDTYTGDGGERWAASMAASHERGILLDAVRIKAAEVAAEVEDVRGQTLTEMAAAAYALARAETLMRSSGPNGPMVPLPVAGGG